MPDYIYLLENRLSADQRNAIRQLREAAREAGMILFLTGDAVRDLTSGHHVRELEVAVHGNALKLKKPIEKLGGSVWGEDAVSGSLYLCFPGTVRVDVVSTQRTEYPKPGKPVYHGATIQEELRRRDFTVNAMAISLNEGSFGLLMDPLNGAADIEARTLRLASNYGFLEEPSRLIRATRYLARLGWEFDPKTQTRYENAKAEGVIEHLSAEARSRELEQIGHEEEGLKILRALEAEGWEKVLFPAWTSAKADEDKLQALHDQVVELQLLGIHPDMSAAQMQLLTAKLAPKDLAALKKLMLRPGFVEEWNNLDAMAAGFAKALLAKENQTPSVAYKLFMSYDPEAVLWLGFTSKDKAVRERYTLFLKTWPEARQRIPHALMMEMRITPDLANYSEIVHEIFLQLIDGKLATTEEMKAFLEPHSPPPPPPQITIKRTRAKRGEAKIKDTGFDDDEESDDELEDDDDLDDAEEDEDEIDIGLTIPKAELEAELGSDLEIDLGEPDDELEADAEDLAEEIEDDSEPEMEPELDDEPVNPRSKPAPQAKGKAAVTAEKSAKSENTAKKAAAKPTEKAADVKSSAKPAVKTVAKPPAKGKAQAGSKAAPAKAAKKPVPAKGGKKR